MHNSCSGRCRILRTAASLWREGMLLLAQDDPIKAEVMQRQALDLVRGIGGFFVLQARIHNNIGVILSCSGRHAEASAEFATALELLGKSTAPTSGLSAIIAKNHRTTLKNQQTEATACDMALAM